MFSTRFFLMILASIISSSGSAFAAETVKIIYQNQILGFREQSLVNGLQQNGYEVVSGDQPADLTIALQLEKNPTRVMNPVVYSKAKISATISGTHQGKAVNWRLVSTRTAFYAAASMEGMGVCTNAAQSAQEASQGDAGKALLWKIAFKLDLVSKN